jgi:hypothetical protein
MFDRSHFAALGLRRISGAIAAALIVGLSAGFFGIAPARAQIAQAEADAFADAVIAADARSWFVNGYDAGSASGTRAFVTSTVTRSAELKSRYTYNRGQPGSVRILVQEGEVLCVEFWDSPGICQRPRGVIPDAALVRFQTAAFSPAPAKPAQPKPASSPSAVAASAPPPAFKPTVAVTAAMAPYLDVERQRTVSETAAIAGAAPSERRWLEEAKRYRARFDWLGGVGLDRSRFEQDTTFAQSAVPNRLDLAPIEYFRSSFALLPAQADSFWGGLDGLETRRNSLDAVANSLVNPISRPTVVAGDLRLFFASGLEPGQIQRGLAQCKSAMLTQAQQCDCAAGYPGYAAFGAGIGEGTVNTNRNAGKRACEAAIEERRLAGQPESPFLLAQLNRLSMWALIETGGPWAEVEARADRAVQLGFVRARVQRAMINTLRFRSTGAAADLDAAVAAINTISGLYPADAYAMRLIVEDVARAASLTSALMRQILPASDPNLSLDQRARDEIEFYQLKQAEQEFYRYRAPPP